VSVFAEVRSLQRSVADAQDRSAAVLFLLYLFARPSPTAAEAGGLARRRAFQNRPDCLPSAPTVSP
jgi:hypothetical protein